MHPQNTHATAPAEPEGGPRIFLGPAWSEFVGTDPAGAPIAAGAESGVGPMTEITEHVVAFNLGAPR